MKVQICAVWSLVRQEQRGAALIYVIAVSGIVALIIGILMTQYILQSRSVSASIQSVQSYYSAEAGVLKTQYYLTETKGIQWRTGMDSSIVERVFCSHGDRVEISVADDCGFVKIRSRAKDATGRTIELLAAGIIPDSACVNLCVHTEKPLILGTGSRVNGVVRLNQTPLFQGGSIEGLLETNSDITLPPLLNTSFARSIDYFRTALSEPEYFARELISPQVFSPDNPLPATHVYVNDAVLIENSTTDSVWHVGSDLKIASTAIVQISGSTALENTEIMAIGTVKILDKAELNGARIFSLSGIELADDVSFSGVLIAPYIMVTDRAIISQPSVVYCGLPFESGKISILSDNPVHCCIFNLRQAESYIIIDERAQVRGLVYSRAPITLKGEVKGCVYCSGFYDEPVTQDTTNTNILSGTIDTLSGFVIPLVFENIKKFNILQWREY
jgi:hypothetical protein